ncbi:unnamed protein product, partial [Rotaria socialis]
MKFLKLITDEPIIDERVRTLIDEELQTFDIKQGNSIKKVEDINNEFIKNNFNSLTHRAE